MTAMHDAETPMIAFATPSLASAPPARLTVGRPRRLSRRRQPVLPGFGTTAAITSLVIGALVIVPLAVLVARAASLGAAGFAAAAPPAASPRNFSSWGTNQGCTAAGPHGSSIRCGRAAT